MMKLIRNISYFSFILIDQKYNEILNDERCNIVSLTVIRNGFISKDTYLDTIFF